jgi:GT2 family glycosyltransferase
VTQGFAKALFKNTSNFRLIFVDNGSTDNTPDFLKSGEEQNKWKVVSPGKNLGVIGGRNLGAQHVESEYFMNIDNDQYPGRGWLEGLFDLIDQGYDIVGPEAWDLIPPKTGGAVVMGGQVVEDRTYFPYKHCKLPRDSFSYIGCGGTLMKTAVYEKIGLFDERFSPAYFEDPDFNFRALLAGFKLGWHPKCPIVHLAHQTFNAQQLFNKKEQFNKSWKAFRDKWHPYFPKPTKMPGR